jgi:hypothetical protein
MQSVRLYLGDYHSLARECQRIWQIGVRLNYVPNSRCNLVPDRRAADTVTEEPRNLPSRVLTRRIKRCRTAVSHPGRSCEPKAR